MLRRTPENNCNSSSGIDTGFGNEFFQTFLFFVIIDSCSEIVTLSCFLFVLPCWPRDVICRLQAGKPHQ